MSKPNLSIVPDSPEVGPPRGFQVVDTDRERIERQAAELGGVVFSREPYVGLLEDETDLFEVYVRQAKTIPLLTEEQEVFLADDIQKAKTAAEAIKNEDFSILTEAVARKALMKGQVATSTLVNANLRWVIKLSARSAYQNRGLSRLELIQEGNIGLLKAAEKFDPERGRFTTIASIYIKRAMSRAVIKKGPAIPVTLNYQTQINELNYSTKELRDKLGTEPTTAQIAAYTGLTQEKVLEMRRLVQQADTLSIHGFTNEDGDEIEASYLADDRAQEPFKQVERAMVNARVSEILDELNERERAIITMRFGLTDGQIRTLEDVGREFKLTHERIRQIESKALAKLRDSARSLRVSAEDLPD